MHPVANIEWCFYLFWIFSSVSNLSSDPAGFAYALILNNKKAIKRQNILTFCDKGQWASFITCAYAQI